MSKKEDPKGSILGNDEQEKPAQAVRKKKPTEVTVDNKALRDMLTRLASLEIHDLQQLTDLPLKLIDPIAKGLSYYDATLTTLNEQCSELLDWYILKCKGDIARCDSQLAAIGPQATDDKKVVNPIVPVKVRKLSAWDKFWGKKIIIDPELEKFEITERKAELVGRLAELKEERAFVDDPENAINTEEMFFKKWAYHLYLHRRSLGGHMVDSLTSLADAQIVTQQEGSLDKYGSILHR